MLKTFEVQTSSNADANFFTSLVTSDYSDYKSPWVFLHVSGLMKPES